MPLELLDVVEVHGLRAHHVAAGEVGDQRQEQRRRTRRAEVERDRALVHRLDRGDDLVVGRERRRLRIHRLLVREDDVLDGELVLVVVGALVAHHALADVELPRLRTVVVGLGRFGHLSGDRRFEAGRDIAGHVAHEAFEHRLHDLAVHPGVGVLRVQQPEVGREPADAQDPSIREVDLSVLSVSGLDIVGTDVFVLDQVPVVIPCAGCGE